MYAVTRSLPAASTIKTRTSLEVTHELVREDIQKACTQKPCYDKILKVSEADKWTKRIHKAREVLSKHVDKKINYRQEDQLISSEALLPGRQLSIAFTELFAAWLKESLSVPRRQFPYVLKHLLTVLLEKQFKHWIKAQAKTTTASITKTTTASKIQTKPTTVSKTKTTTVSKKQAIKLQLYDQCLKSAGIMAINFSILSTSETHKVVCDLLKVARTTPNKQFSSVVKARMVVPIIDFSKANSSQLDTLSMLFLGECNTSLSHNARIAALSEYIPQVVVQFMKTKSNTCVMCSQKLPKKPPSPCIVLPRLGHMKPQKVCISCCELTSQQDMNAWIKGGIELLKSGGLANIRPALGCFTLAVCSYQISAEVIMKLVKEFANLGIPGLGLPLVSDLLKNPTDAMTAHFLACSLLQAIAELPNEDLFGQWQLLRTAKQACDRAHTACTVGSAEDSLAPDLVATTSDIDKALKVHMEKIKHKHKQLVEELLDTLERAWSEKDWEKLLSMIKEKNFDNLAEVTDGQHFQKKALEQFVASKKEILSKMPSSDCSLIILLFRGVLSLQKKQITSGLKVIEAVAWNSHNAKWLQKEIIAIVLTLLSKYRESIMPTNSLQITCNSLARTAKISSSCFLFTSIEELVALPKMHWHELGSSEETLHSQFELSVAKKVNEGTLTNHKAALAYIDHCIACHHPAEKAVCFLTASVWFLREMKQTLATIQLPELYALRAAIHWSIDQALGLAHMFLHPGMCVYVSSVGLAIMLDTVRQTNELATHEDSELVAHLLEMFTYNCRFCPFWHAPIVTVSEAVLLHNLSGQLNNEFLLGLKNTTDLELPVSNTELRYQIYENSIRHLCPMEDPTETRRNAMLELLKEEGWSIQDVANLMTSPLNFRTPDGWLIQQPTLGPKLEYAKIAGFVVNTEPAIIQLLVAPASETRVGLISRADVNSFLQLNNDELFPMYVAMDPPNHTQHRHFHPFQQIQYSSEKLKGTSIFHTMLEADYLLKSFRVGSEVSSVPPFRQRPCSDGLTANLPPKLRKVLKPLSEREGGSGYVSNIWLQAEELKYSTLQTPNGTIFIFSDPVMAVRSKLQTKYDGKLSPDAQFAADVTSHYDEIKKHFPVFARLQELVKLQFFGIVLNIAIEKAKIGNVADAVVSALENYQQQSQVGSTIVCLDNLIAQVRPRYPSEAIVSLVVNQILKETNFKLDHRTLTSKVSYWLISDYNRSKSTDAAKSRLASYISSLGSAKPQMKDLLHGTLDPNSPFLSKAKKLKKWAAEFSSSKMLCKWVPSVMNTKEDGGMFCHGGVLFAPQVKYSTVAIDLNTLLVNLEPEMTVGTSMNSSKHQEDVHECNGDSPDPRLGWNRAFDKSEESKIDGNDYIDFDDIVRVTREGAAQNQLDPQTESDQAPQIKFKISPLNITLSADGEFILSASQAELK